MRTSCILACVVVVLCVGARPAPAMHEWEVWRSPFGGGNGLAVNATDGTAWASIGDSVYHYAADQTLLSKTELWHPESVGVDSRDGSCWVADRGPADNTVAGGAVIHLAADGTEAARATGFVYPVVAASAGPDGSVWVSDSDYGSGMCRLSEAGQLLAERGGLLVDALAVNPGDGTCWVLDYQPAQDACQLVHLGTDGAVLLRGGLFTVDRVEPVAQRLLAVNGGDSSVWVAEGGNGDVVHISEAGAELSRTHFPAGLFRVTLDPRDATCWVTVPGGITHVATDGSVLETVVGPAGRVAVDPTSGAFWGTWTQGVVCYAADGSELWRTGESLVRTWFSQADHSCWTSSNTGELVRVSGLGEELWRGVPYSDAYTSPARAVNPADGSMYFVFAQEAMLLRLALDGTEEWVPLTYAPTVTVPATTARALAVNPSDGSFWVYVGDTIDAHARTVAVYCHFAADGSQLGSVSGTRPDTYCEPAVDPADGSVWVTGTLSGAHGAAHFAADGTLLWRQELAGVGPGLSLDLEDGSCWMGGDSLRLFARDGTPLLAIPVSTRDSVVAVDSVTHACWTSEGWRGDVSVFNRTGARLWRCPGFAAVSTVSVDRRDGSVWVYSMGHRQIVHLWAPTTPFYDVLPGHWAGRAIRMCYEYGIVGGYPDGYYHPEWGVSRAAMAGFISRALAEGDANVPPGPETPHFPDVPTDYWAYKYVEYAYANNIVAGYPGGLYGPEVPVDRGQMAAFVARAIVNPTGEAGLAGYVPPETPTFPDVPTDFWTYKHVEYLREAGIVGGYPDGRYRPENWCTRDQMAGQNGDSYLIAGVRGSDSTVVGQLGSSPHFADFWTYKHIEYIKEAGIVGGYPDGRYRPENWCTRDQMAVFIARAFELLPY